MGQDGEGSGQRCRHGIVGTCVVCELDKAEKRVVSLLATIEDAHRSLNMSRPGEANEYLRAALVKR